MRRRLIRTDPRSSMAHPGRGPLRAHRLDDGSRLVRNSTDLLCESAVYASTRGRSGAGKSLFDLGDVAVLAVRQRRDAIEQRARGALRPRMLQQRFASGGTVDAL
jgi:hypothetical protein